tara:strand:+ start:2152 stop:2871 length:720 start_codon:yes stop_codon:yes gene_type:complete
MATTNVNVTQIPAPRVPLLNAQTGAVSMEWFLWFNNIYTITGAGLAVTPVINGGTGLNAIPTNGQLLIGNGTGYALGTLTASTGITVTNGLGTITVTNSLPDLTVVLTGAGTTVVTGTYPNFTITSNDAFVGTVTSVGGTGTVNGITLTGTVTTSGNLTLGGTLSGVSLTTQVSGILPVANGGNGLGAAYTVATLPAAGTQGRRAWVTNALAPTFLSAPVGGGAVVCPVFDNGTAWVVG